jgi:Flp pilus assembly protein TadG
MRKPSLPQENKGQVLVIFAVSLLVLLIFIGLAVDGSQLFLNYTRLKRAVDAAAVAAANDFKRGSNLDRMDKAALEILNMHQIDTTTVQIKVYMCDQDGDGVRDASLATEVPEFYKLCPATGLQKKLIYVRAYENSPTYFVSLVGIHTIPISTTAVAEAAPVDLVIVLDTSESMGRDTPGFNPGDFNPAACNAANNCQPLTTAKDAAKYLINSLYQGYDRVAVVTFDTQANTRFLLGDVDAASAAVDSLVKLHDDPPVNKLFASWYNAGTNGRFNPVNPEDRDNNGADPDPKNSPLADSTVCTITTPLGDRWDDTKNIPCDDPNYLDAFDWDQDGHYSGESCAVNPNSDRCKSENWVAMHGTMSLVSTCSGCGMRAATDELVRSGRSNAVWVIVFLSDGLANMSDTPATFPYNASTGQGIPPSYPNGFCGGKIDVSGTGAGVNYWKTNCVDWDVSTRYCINSDPATCPPHSTALAGNASPPYSVEDYARDMTDRAALTVVNPPPGANPADYNTHEPRGNDIAIYSVGFGDIAALGEPLLRYMAAVGDDGDRNTDPCVGVPAKHKCGQYYFAQNPSDLLPVFQDIASRIYTKISE